MFQIVITHTNVLSINSWVQLWSVSKFTCWLWKAERSLMNGRWWPVLQTYSFIVLLYSAPTPLVYISHIRVLVANEGYQMGSLPAFQWIALLCVSSMLGIVIVPQRWGGVVVWNVFLWS